GRPLPPCVRRRRMANRGLVGPHVVVPVGALPHIAHRELPVLGWLLDPFQKSLALFVLGDVEEELANRDPVARRTPPERVDVFVALLPDVRRDQRLRNAVAGEILLVDADDDRFLVVRAVEDTNAPTLRQLLMRAPVVIVIELLL